LFTVASVTPHPFTVKYTATVTGRASLHYFKELYVLVPHVACIIMGSVPGEIREIDKLLTLSRGSNWIVCYLMTLYELQKYWSV
jgi:hypothetical protein